MYGVHTLLQVVYQSHVGAVESSSWGSVDNWGFKGLGASKKEDPWGACSE